MNEFESDWISLSQSGVEWECFWVNQREDNKVSESKMAVAESNMAEFKLATIMKMSQNQWVKFLLCKWWEPMNEHKFFCANGENQSWQVWVSMREKTKMAES